MLPFNLTTERDAAHSTVCVLAFDLGTNTGMAMRCADGSIRHRLKEFPKRGGYGFRYQQFRRWLIELQGQAGKIDAIYYEEINFAQNADAPVIYGMTAIITAWCEHHQILYRGIGPGTIKKFITGDGRAKKPAIIAAVNDLGFHVEDDNVADAIALLLLGLDRMKTGAVLPKPKVEMAVAF